MKAQLKQQAVLSSPYALGSFGGVGSSGRDSRSITSPKGAARSIEDCKEDESMGSVSRLSKFTP